MKRVTMPREFYIPNGATKVADKASDAIAYLYTTTSGKPAARIFWGKGEKPISAHYYLSDAARESAIRFAFEARRNAMSRKRQQAEQRKAFIHSFVVGDILNTCWGYDQTNREFFEVVEVKGKWLILREIAQERVGDGFCSGKCVPLPGQYVGEPIRRLAGEHGVTIDDVRRAHLTTTTKVGGVKVVQPLSWSDGH